MNLEKFRIKAITPNGNGYDVESNSGNTYHVKSRTRLDSMGSMFFAWECNCPARKRCRHIDAIEQYRWEEAGADDAQMLERFE